MSRTPRSRRPPLLPDPIAEAAARMPPGPSRRDLLKRDHVAGRSARFGRAEVLSTMRRVVEAAPPALMGLHPFSDLADHHVQAAVATVFGWNGDGPRARIGPSRCLTGMQAACARIVEVGRRGGRIAFATGRPASLLGLYQALAAAADAAGAKVLEQAESSAVGPGGRRLWWIDGVAVLTDHESVLATDARDVAEELLFCLPTPDLVVADRAFAGTAVAAGLEVVAFTDLDAVALAVAAWRGMAIRVVPIDAGRPPAAYAPLLEVLAEAVDEASELAAPL